MGFEFRATVSADYVRPDLPDVPILITATSFWRKGAKWFKSIPPANLPSHLTNVAVDPGGFTATIILKEYPFSLDQYVDWLNGIRPMWAATMDYCCFTDDGDPLVIRQRQDQTTANAWDVWNRYRESSWRWLPTIQGWDVNEYIYHARQMKPLLEEMRAHYGESFTVGIGSLCKRASVEMIRDVTQAISWELPGFKFHLWGIKLKAIRSGLPDCVVSSDSSTWRVIGSFAAHRDRYLSSGMSKRGFEIENSLPAYREMIDTARASHEDIDRLPLFKL